MVLAMAVFTANDTFMKQVIESGLPLMQVIFLRGLAATVLVAGAVVVAGHAREVAAGVADKAVFARSFVEFLSISLFSLALARAPIGDVVALAMTAPLILMPLAVRLAGEHVGPRRWAIVGAGFVGALLVAQPFTAGFDPILVFALASAFTQAARDLLSRFVPRTIPALVVTLSTVTVVMLFAGLGTLVVGWQPPAIWQVGYTVAAGALLSLGHFLLFVAFRHAPATVVAPFGYAATVWAVLSGVVVFGDALDPVSLIGIAVLTVSGILLLRTQGR